MTTARTGNFTPCKSRKVEYIVLHYTADRGTADENKRAFENLYTKSSAHYFVDDDEVCQSVDDMDIAFSVGATGGYVQKHPFCRNQNSISIEMCCVKDAYTITKKTEDRAIELVASLMEKYNIPIENVIRHGDVVNKKCPASYFDNPALWENFKERLRDVTMKYNTIEEVPDWGKEAIEVCVKRGYLKGDQNGMLGITPDLLRIIVILHRAGVIK